jgi:transposase
LKILFGDRGEKTADLFDPQDKAPPENGTTPPSDGASLPDEPPEKKPGHGRNGAEDFPAATREKVPHESFKPGDACPECQKGTLYEAPRPGVLIRFVGRPPLQATVYELQKLRCNLCGEVFTAKLPAMAGGQKYDATVASMIGIFKYGSGLPFNRLAGLQGSLGIPLAASTQWKIVEAATPSLLPAYEELIRQAAQGDVVYNDDTTVKILELMGKRAKRALVASGGDELSPERKGLFTSGVVVTRAGIRIALFFSGRQHAGENLADVLRLRADELSPPIQMCDALSRNAPGDLQTILANCLAHARRQFVDIVDNFPGECRHVLEAFKAVYHNDSQARERELSPEERLAFHVEQSGPVMEALHDWLKRQFSERLVEPNSGLGGAINYLLKHWEKLTLFLRQAGAPLDNNICERALKKAILHRKNALFYKTLHGAKVGDIYMSLIHTCNLCGANPQDYLTELQRHADEVAAAPQNWMPWNYRASLDAAA